MPARSRGESENQRFTSHFVGKGTLKFFVPLNKFRAFRAIITTWHTSPGRSVLKIHFFIKSSLKMIQSGIFIQKNIHSKKYSFNRVQNIQKNYSIKKNEENYSEFQNKAKIWLRSPSEAPVWVIDPLK